MGLTAKSCLLFLLCIASLAKAQSQPTAVNLRVLWAPHPTMIDGKPMVYYELLVDNLLNDSLDLKALQVMQTSDHSVVASFNRDDLKQRFSDANHKGRKGVLNPDGSGVIYLEIALKQADAGVHLIHRLEVDALNEGPVKKSFSVEGGKIQRSKTSPVVLGMPLRGGPWVAIYEPSWERGHRRVMFTTDGEQHIPGRFAIDFIRPDQQGRFSNGDSDSTRNWYSYSAPVLAASDGVVVATRIDFMLSLLEGHRELYCYRHRQQPGRILRAS